MPETEIVILSGARTAIGTFGGSLAGIPPIQLAATVTRAAIERAGIAPAQVGTVVFGHVLNTEPRDMYLSRVAMLDAGVPDTTPAMNVNRLCGSGAQAIVSAAQALMLGDADFAVAGGAESMSRAPYAIPAARFGVKMGDAPMLDMMTGALTCPMGTGHMGVTAENVAREHGISRRAQDEFALESQRRAAAAIAEGRFRDQIVPIEIKTRKGVVAFDTDEHPKETSLDKLAGLKAVFQRDGTVTAGNASGINDGAAALVLARGDAARVAGQTPAFRLLGRADRIVKIEERRVSLDALERALREDTEVDDVRVLVLPGQREQLAAVVVPADPALLEGGDAARRALGRRRHVAPAGWRGDADRRRAAAGHGAGPWRSHAAGAWLLSAVDRVSDSTKV